MSQQPGEPPAGPGTDAAAEAARESDDPGALQVDVSADEGDAGDDELVGDGLSPGVHEADKSAETRRD